MSYSSHDIVFPFQDVLKLEERELLLKNSNIVNFGKKEIIFRQNIRTSHIMLVLSGLVKIYKIGANKKRVILKLTGENEYLGMMSVFGSAIHEYSAAAVNDVEVCYTDIDTFKYVIKNNGNFAIKIINSLSKNGLYIFQRMIGQSHKQLPGKIADVLLYFSEVIYKSKKFIFPLTRIELAEMAGTTKESFIRTLMEFKNDKIIELDGSGIEIKSIDIVKILSEMG